MPRGIYERKPRAAPAVPASPPPGDKRAKKRKYRKAPRPTAAAPFIPAIDADSRLIIVNGAEPHIFDPQQTEAIATLLATHFE